MAPWMVVVAAIQIMFRRSLSCFEVACDFPAELQRLCD